MSAHTVASPRLFDRRLAARLLQLHRAAAAAVCRRKVVGVPRRWRDVQAPIALVWMPPEQFAVVRIQPDDVIGDDRRVDTRKSPVVHARGTVDSLRTTINKDVPIGANGKTFSRRIKPRNKFCAKG